MTGFLLAHLTDPHLVPPAKPWTLGDIVSKRLLSRLSWRRKRRFAHRTEVLSAIVADIRAQAPDHVAVTGDITNFADEGEFAAARSWFATLGATEDVTVSPGNHDALVARGHRTRFASWRPWFGDAEETGFPYVRRRGPLAIVNLCSALPTPPLLAGGRLGAAQLSRLGKVLDDARREGLVRVVLIHHPPDRLAASARACLWDAAALGETLLRHGAELILHGHVHHPHPTTLPGPNGPIPVVGVSSASARTHGNPQARWHGFRITGAGEAAQVELIVRGFEEGGEVVVELARKTLGQPR